jgi:phenylalanine ammonia-lyase
VEIASMMSAMHLYTCCQALDLQVMHLTYMAKLRADITASMPKTFGGILDDEGIFEAVTITMEAIANRLQEVKNRNTLQQAVAAAESTVMPLVAFVCQHIMADEKKGEALTCIMLWKERCVELITDAVSSARRTFGQEATIITNEHLSHGSKILYNFVRNELQVPLHKGLVEHASYDMPSPEGIHVPASKRALIGKQVSIIYCAIREGKLHDVLIKSLI